ncbi:MAG: DUF2147 domain-containing protein [Cytophagales bacterium]|nr:DUF2147 domain-containing protein [Cytophagales bacterium]
MEKILYPAFLIFSLTLSAQVSINEKDCLGVWKTIDDETGITKSTVEVFKKDKLYYGRVLEILDPDALKDSGKERYEDILCDECPEGKGKDQPIMGLDILWAMEKGSDKWSNGKIMDPENGKIYTCTMWLEDDDEKGNTLKVRGWLAFFFRTQTWYRVEG